MTNKIIYTAITLRPEYLDTLQALAPNYEFRNPKTPISTEELAQVEMLLGWHPEIGQQILALENHSLKWIQANSAGVDYLDLAQLAEQGILLSNMSGIHAIPIAESVIGMLLTRYRGIQASILGQAKREWVSYETISYDELNGKKMLIIGPGKIGQRLALISQGLGVEVSGVSRSGRQLEHFKTIYKQADAAQHFAEYDIIVNILPLTKETHHYYNDSFFQQIKPGASFINVGRGPSVDTDALIRALETKQLSFAGLDVFEEEPLAADSPLWAMENVLITPHISGLVRHFQQKVTEIYRENLTSYLTNQTLTRNPVDLTAGY